MWLVGNLVDDPALYVKRCGYQICERRADDACWQPIRTLGLDPHHALSVRSGLTVLDSIEVSLTRSFPSSLASPTCVRVSGDGAVRLGDDGLQHCEVNSVEIVDVQASHAGSMRPQLPGAASSYRPTPSG